MVVSDFSPFQNDAKHPEQSDYSQSCGKENRENLNRNATTVLGIRKKKHHAINIPTLDQQLYTKKHFKLFQANVSLRSLTHDGTLDRIDDEFLRYYLQFGPLPGSYHYTLQNYRESLGEVLIYHMV